MTTLQESTTQSLVNAEELEAAKQVALSLNNAFKYYALYPEGHAFSRTYLSKFKDEIKSFLDAYKVIRLDTSKSSFFYKGETVFHGNAEENNSAYLLSRDRILYLEFTKNITEAEISQLLDILKRHRNPLDNDDSDIATTLWHYKFSNLNYEAADIFAMEAIQFELSMFKAVPGQGDSESEAQEGGDSEPGGADSDGSAAGGEGQGGTGGGDFADNEQASEGNGTQGGQNGAVGSETPSSLDLLSQNVGLIELDQEEQNKLSRMVHHAENSDNTSDVVDILLITLSIEPNEIDFASILEFLELECFDALAKEEFPCALKICKNAANISEAIKIKKPWAFSLISLFFAALGREDRLGEMPWLNEYERIAANPEQNKALLGIFKQLSGDIILILGKLLEQIPPNNDSVREEIMDMIAAKARATPHVFGRLIEQSSEETIQQLLPIIEQLEKKSAAQIYLVMTRHNSIEIRTTGIHEFFLAEKSPNVEDVVRIMLEPERSLRLSIVSYVATLHGALQEQILIAFLGNGSAQVDDEKYIMHCYKMLSKCVSSSSVEFLQRNLLESDLKSMFSHNLKAHKLGAAYVLNALGTREAKSALKKGAESMRPDVRNICKKFL